MLAIFSLSNEDENSPVLLEQKTWETFLTRHYGFLLLLEFYLCFIGVTYANKDIDKWPISATHQYIHLAL